MKSVIALLDWAQTTSSPLGVILLDAEKAFDRVTWGYLWAVLRWKGFSIEFIHAIQALYLTPAATLRLIDISTGYFQIGRGTRQGCLFTPALWPLHRPFFQYVG